MIRARNTAATLALISLRSASVVAQPSASPPLFEAPTRADIIGRVLVPVTVNGQGPFQFVLDTGANRTVLTPRLVSKLGLEITPHDKVTMSGVTGSASVPTVLVSKLQVGEVALERERLPVADSLSLDTDGTLGVDALGGTRVRVDFVNRRVQIRLTHHGGLLDGLTRIPGQCRFRRLLMIQASVGRIPVAAVIDTGSQYTLANPALRTRLGFRPQKEGVRPTEVIGETLARQPGERLPVPVIRMGPVQTLSPNVVFGDFYVFKLWKLDTEPAVVVGMDLLGTLDTLLIDYERCEMQIRTRGEGLRD
jgi:hypothetical protein